MSCLIFLQNILDHWHKLLLHVLLIHFILLYLDSFFSFNAKTSIGVATWSLPALREQPKTSIGGGHVNSLSFLWIMLKPKTSTRKIPLNSYNTRRRSSLALSNGVKNESQPVPHQRGTMTFFERTLFITKSSCINSQLDLLLFIHLKQLWKDQVGMIFLNKGWSMHWLCWTSNSSASNNMFLVYAIIFCFHMK